MNPIAAGSAGSNSDEAIISQASAKPLGFPTLLYFTLYCIGARIIRFSRRVKRRVRKGLLHCKWFVKRKFYDLADWITGKSPRSLRSKFHRNFVLPFQDSARNLQKRKEGEPLRFTAAIAPAAHVFGKIASYLLPVCGVFALAAAIHHFSSLTYALRVEYNGEYIGYVQNESEFAEAEREVRQRLVNEAYLPPEDSTPIYTMEVVQPDQLSEPDLLVNNIIQASGNQFQEAAGLYVNDRFIGAVSDGDQLLMDLKAMKDVEREKEGADAQVDFVQDIKVEKGLYPVSSLSDLSNISEELNKEVKGEIVYIIQEGDSPSLIADKFDVPTRTLLALNPEVSKTMLIGEPYYIEPMQRFLQKKVTKTVVENQEVPFTTVTEYDDSKGKSYSEVLQEGQNGLTAITSEIVYVDGYEIERNVVSRNIIREPVSAKVVIGSLSASPYNFSGGGATGGKNVGGYIWPVNGGYISCPIWGYYNHTGTDIAAPHGTTIWASKDGTVSYAGWSRGYGYNILVNHADGTKTRYAHCSSLAVTTGQRVSQGQVIGYVGRTGNATGNHCHFEIISNGQYLDARQYIGYSR